MTTAAAGVRLRRVPPLLPPIAIAVFVLVVGAVLGVSGDTLGFDFLAYLQAAERVLAGERLYDTTVQETGGFGLFYYPPPFVLPILPLALLDPISATLGWLAMLAAAFATAIAILPVAARVRWTVLLLAGLSWPVAYTFKLGQVGPLLMLGFAVAWRSLDRPARLGVAGAVGALIKLQPGLVLGWAALTGRWRAVAVGAAVGLAAAGVATILLGVDVWLDYVQLLRQVADPVTTPHNFTPGAVAFQLGVPAPAASILQLVSSVVVVVVLLAAVRAASPTASFLVALVASQLLSPVLWDHYAVLLLLPVAWLLDRGHWWAVFVPLATSIVVVGITPPVAYPFGFFVVLLALLVVGVRERQAARPAAGLPGTAA